MDEWDTSEPVDTADPQNDELLDDVSPADDIVPDDIASPDDAETVDELLPPEEATALGEEVSPLERGRLEHSRWEEDFREHEDREEGCDTFTIEKAIRDTEGRVVRDEAGRLAKPDYVDYQSNVIVDHKPLHEGEDPNDVYAQYLDQLSRYMDIYERARGVTPSVALDFYRV